MAINTLDSTNSQSPIRSLSSSIKGHSACRLSINTSFGNNQKTVSRRSSKTTDLPKDAYKSPYLTGDKDKVKCRVTGKAAIPKRESGITSSFPLAANIYRANSDEFKTSKRTSKKVKKSVLTLPNVRAPKPQECTVSDTNDSELFQRVDICEKPKTKRPVFPKKKQTVPLEKRDSLYSQLLGMSTESSSFEMLTHFDGDVNRRKKTNVISREGSLYKAKHHDIWTMLRNMNRFQFRPSPVISEESITTAKKKKTFNRKPEHWNKSRFIQSRRKDEVHYISNLEIETLSTSNSVCPASSSGRVTVIDKHDAFEALCNEFQERMEQMEIAEFHNKNIKMSDCNRGKPPNKLGKKTNKSKSKKKCLQPTNHVLQKTSKQNENFDYPFAVNKINSAMSSQTTLTSVQSVIPNRNEISIIAKPETVINDMKTTNKNLKNKNLSSMKQCVVNNNYNFNDCRNTIKSPIKSLNYVTDNTQILVKNNRFLPMKTNKCLSPRKGVPSPPPLASMYQNNTIENSIIDVKRIIARLKFPITILGRDQISSTYEVVTIDPPQFEGMGNKIWPFMTDWCYIKKGKNGIAGKVNKVLQYCWNKKIATSSQTKEESKISVLKKQGDGKRSVSREKTTRNSMSQFKDKMLKLMCKNTVSDPDEIFRIISSDTDMEIRSDSKTNIQRMKNVKRSPSPKAATETRNLTQNKTVTMDIITRHANTNHKQGIAHTFNDDKHNFQKSNAPRAHLKKKRYTWAKAEQASDFIDGVITKIRAGVYCNQENAIVIDKIKEIEPSSQNNETSNIQDVENDTIEKEGSVIDAPECDPLSNIDGFDETFPGLEVETLNNNRVAIKNCILNVLVNFDIALKSNIPGEPKPSSCVPVTITSNKTQIFKCTTTILNAMLPAELCTILPNIMRNIVLAPQMSHEIFADESNKSQLSVTKVSKFDNYFLDIRMSCNSTIVDHLSLESTIPPKGSRELRRLICGEFHLQKSFCNLKNTCNINLVDIVCLKPTKLRCLTLLINPMNSRMQCKNNAPKAKSSIKLAGDVYNTPTKCTAIMPYNPPEHKISLIHGIFCTPEDNVSQPLVSIKVFKKLYETNLNDEPYSYGYNIWKETDHNKVNNISQCRALVKYIKPLHVEIKERIEQRNQEINKIRNLSLAKKKIRRRRFVRLFRKCKSMTNITEERDATALNKITNLEEMFRALGTGKTLSSVFDAASENKIMNCFIEMRNWIKEISPKQILLVLLLMNKKETHNLMKLTPMILQAIAANRITKSSELDMEVEVIEKERFTKLPRYEGIFYIPASSENCDSLLEELVWIAKTTASDYQKPFDDSSEKLLKLLLEKRKKLNPAYLRVMARYVGLGLLKKPK